MLMLYLFRLQVRLYFVLLSAQGVKQMFRMGSYCRLRFVMDPVKGAQMFTIASLLLAVSSSIRYWEVRLWDKLFDELLNVNHRDADLAQTGAMLARLEESLVSYIRDCPQRSDQLQDLLRQQDNMLSNR